MDETRSERWGAASGLAAFVVGAVGGALERGWPSASDPAAVAAFIAANRTAILAQSMAFVPSAGFYLWFFGSLRSFLIRSERGTGRLSHAFPIWLGWLSVVAAVAQMLLFAGTVVRSGPLAPNGWLTYALYPVIAVWLLPTTLVMIKQASTVSSSADRRS